MVDVSNPDTKTKSGQQGGTVGFGGATLGREGENPSIVNPKNTISYFVEDDNARESQIEALHLDQEESNSK